MRMIVLQIWTHFRDMRKESRVYVIATSSRYVVLHGCKGRNILLKEFILLSGPLFGISYLADILQARESGAYLAHQRRFW